MQELNFCKTKHLMSECSAEKPEDCKFFEKASQHSRCTFQTISLGDCYNCANTKAQADFRENNIEEIEIFLENEEGDLPI